MAYNPTLLVQYDGITIEPGPQISIDKEPIYANNNVIGYVYTLNLSGYASSIIDADIFKNSNAFKSARSMGIIQEILQRNGKTFTIFNNCTNTFYLKAYGGHLKSFNVEEGNWFNYIKYTASIEFSEIVFYGNEQGFTISIAPDSVSVTDPIMADMLTTLKKYNDSWKFTIPENEAYLYYARIANLYDGPTPVSEDYTQINVEYTISAQGKHYYDVNDTTYSAWENAKKFVQYKLYWQIASFRMGGLLSQNLFNNTTYTSNDIGVSMNEALSSTSFISPAVPPILDRTIVDRYAIYNESINCSTSEVDGTFTATYTCTLKRFDPFIGSPRNSVHTFTINYDQTNDFQSSTRTISINGSLQGMLPTNILANINDGQTFILPTNGFFFFVSNDINTKYAFAWEDFKDYVADETLSDLKDNFKRVLGINYQTLFPSSTPNTPCIQNKGYNYLYQVLAEPKSFVVSHNYSQGTVDYSASYDTERSCAAERGFNNITITEEDSVPQYVEHTIVGRTQGPLLQNLNTNKPKTINIKIEGVTRKGCVGGHPFTTGWNDLDPRYQGISANVCDTDAYIFVPLQVQQLLIQTIAGAQNLGWKLVQTDNNVTYNPVDGSYSVDRTFIVCPPLPNNLVC